MFKAFGWILLLTILGGGCAAEKPVNLVENVDLVWPDPPDPPRIRFLYSLSRPIELGIRKGFFQRVLEFISGEQLERVVKPYDVAAAGNRIYITDLALRVVHIFDLEERSYRHVDRAGDRYFDSPLGIAVDADGRFYVSDPGTREIHLFDRDGKLIRSHKVAKDIYRPTGLAFDPARKDLYLVDTMGHKVVVFDQDFHRRRIIGGRGGGDGNFNYPTHAYVRAGGKLYVVDTFNFRVQVFGPDGKFLLKFGRAGDSLGSFSQPKGVATDSEGNIYVVEGRLSVIKVFSPTGQLLLVFGGLGPERGRFWLPIGLYIDQLDRIYVADSFNQRVQVFQYLGAMP